MGDQTPVSKTSIADIAATLIVQPTEVAPPEAELPPEDDVEELPPEGSDDVEGETPEDVDADETEEVEDEADDDGTPIIDIMDDDLIDVMIDGKLEQRTIGELKKALSGEGAIEKRLQEATELRKTAHAERTTILEKLASDERVFGEALATLDDSLFRGMIPAPDETMRSKNPDLYLRHKDAYEADQKRVNEAKAAVAANLQKLSAQREARLKEYAEAAAPRIAELIPELKVPEKREQTLGRLVETAKAYGYTEQEIGMALDPRMFHLVRDAMRYRELLDGGKAKRSVDLSGEKNKPTVRKLRSGGTKATTMRTAAVMKEQAKLADRARTTGSVQDVAATLIAKRK